MEGLAQCGAESGQPPAGQAHGTASRWERRAKAGQALAWEGARRIPVLGPKPLASSMWPHSTAEHIEAQRAQPCS